MAQLSELVARFRKQQAPTAGGKARGASGSTGAVLFKGRDVDAGLKKEMEIMESPAFDKFLGQFRTKTPMTDYLRSML